MNIIQFIRLIKHHLAILILLPLITAILVFLMVDDSDRTYATGSRIYTGFASGYTLDKETRKDYYTVKTQFDNFFESVRSRTTKEEILLRTLSYYLAKDSIDEREMSIINQTSFYNAFGEDFRTKLVVEGDYESTFLKVQNYYSKNFHNKIYLALNDVHSPLKPLFSIEVMDALEVFQQGTSDLVNLTFQTLDAGVAFKTMNIALEVIMSKVKVIKSAESDDVVAYFLKEVNKAQIRLNEAEKELDVLMTENNITNYYEQTKWLASRNEDFEVAFQKEKLGLAASIAAEKEAEITMGIADGIKEKNNSVMLIRKSIRNTQNRIAKQEIRTDLNYRIKNDTITDEKNELKNQLMIDSLKADLNNSQNELKMELMLLLAMKKTAAGVHVEDLATRWWKAVIEVEEYKARINQFIEFEKEFERTYARFSKLGSKIKQLERKIGVCEKNYLDLLASLNDARLIEENIQLSSGFKIIDAPYYPVNAEKSKKKLLVGLGGLGAFVLVLGILILMEFLDTTIKTPARLADFSGLNLVGGFPLCFQNMEDGFKPLFDRLIRQVCTYINYEFYEFSKNNIPYVVLFFSSRKGEGKTQVMKMIANSLRSSGEKTLVLNSISENNDKPNMIDLDQSDDNRIYTYPSNFFDFSITDEIKNQNLNSSDYRYVFFEIPEIIGSELPITIMKEANLSLMVCRASRVWNKADSMALKGYSKTINHKVSTIINGAMIDELETIIGEIPKVRTGFRKFVKRIASLNFNKKSF